MAKNRYPGRAAKLEIDVTAEGTSYSQITLCRNIVPPEATRAFIEMMGMEDDDFTGEPGIEEESGFSFETLWDVDDTVDASLRTAYEDVTECKFQLTYTDKDANTQVTSWNGFITGLAPAGGGGNDPVVMAVSGVRIGAISES
jgi:hypothetical protein